MTNNLPDYSAVNPPADKPPDEYSTHERRAEVLQVVIRAGSPYAINQSRLSDRYDVNRSTISRDMDRLRESIDEHLGRDAKLTTRVLFERVVDDLLDEDDWRAKKAAFDAVMDWNEWLAEIGEQHREPRRSELDIETRSRNVDVAYQVVREGDDDPLPTTEDGEEIDYEELGFSSAPASIDVESPRGDRDE